MLPRKRFGHGIFGHCPCGQHWAVHTLSDLLPHVRCSLGHLRATRRVLAAAAPTGAFGTLIEKRWHFTAAERETLIATATGKPTAPPAPSQRISTDAPRRRRGECRCGQTWWAFHSMSALAAHYGWSLATTSDLCQRLGIGEQIGNQHHFTQEEADHAARQCRAARRHP
jgi:hypothetical protein